LLKTSPNIIGSVMSRSSKDFMFIIIPPLSLEVLIYNREFSKNETLQILQTTVSKNVYFVNYGFQHFTSKKVQSLPKIGPKYKNLFNFSDFSKAKSFAKPHKIRYIQKYVL